MGETFRRELGLWLFALLAGLVGFLINFAKIGLFFNVDLIVGGIPVMLAVLYCGKKAILSGFIASVTTYFLWHHPYAIIIFTAETVFVSIYRSRGKNIMLADMFYWLIIGMPLVYIFYHCVMHLGGKPTYLVMLKQAINGVVATILASMIYQLINIYRKINGKTYSLVKLNNIFFNIFVVIGFLPLMIYIVHTTRQDSQKLSEIKQKILTEITHISIINTDEYMAHASEHQDLVEDTVMRYGMWNTKESLGELDHTLLKTMMASDTFTSMGVIGRDLHSVSNYVRRGDKAIKLDNQDFSGRDYYTDAEQAKGIYVSDVFSSKEHGVITRKIFMITPLKDSNGKISGYVQGGLNLRTLETIFNELTRDSDIYLTLTDRHGEIITTTNPYLMNTKRYADSRTAGDVSPLSGGIYQWTPPAGDNVTFMSRWTGSYYVSSHNIDQAKGLRIIAESPLASYVRHMNTKGLSSMQLIALMMVLTLMLAWFVSRKISRHVTELSHNSSHLPDKVYRGETITWHRSLFAEVNDLTANFMDMQQQLYVKFFQLKQKTHELKLILDSIPMIIFLKDTRNNIIMGNHTAAEYLRMGNNELSEKHVKKIFPDNYDKLYEDDLHVIKTGEPLRKIMQTYKTPQGEISVLTDKIPVLGQDGRVESILIISQDITDEIKANEERQKTLDTLYQQSKMAEMGAMIAAIAHQWKQPLNTAAMITQVIQSDAEDDTLEKDDLIRNTNLLMSNINFMSQTVADFTGYFKQNKEKQLFKPCETVKEIYALIDRQFIKNNIKVVFHPHDHFEIYGYKNEFKQVCLNVLNNAKDALIESGSKNRKIDVKYKMTDKNGIIIITDNGGGINESLLPDKLFEPYNSTKGDNGTGIGLYICRNIMQQHIGGNITARNTADGAEFTITVPLNGDHTQA